MVYAFVLDSDVLTWAGVNNLQGETELWGKAENAVMLPIFLPTLDGLMKEIVKHGLTNSNLLNL